MVGFRVLGSLNPKGLGHGVGALPHPQAVNQVVSGTWFAMRCHEPLLEALMAQVHGANAM